MKKTPGGIYYHFKHEYRKWKSYDTKWDTMCTRQTFFVILGYFLPFYPHNSLKNENLKKKKKKILEISSFNTSVPKIMIIGYTVPEIWHMMDAIVIFSFWALLFPFIPLTAQKMKNLQKWKKHADIIILHMWTKSHDHSYTVPEI